MLYLLYERRLTQNSVNLLDGTRKLSTLSVSAGKVVVFLHNNVLKVTGTLGNLALTDNTDMHLSPRRQLLFIEGNNLADFSYETFDPFDKDAFPGYNSSVRLRSGALRLNFVEEPLQNIYMFLIKLARLKGIYDAAADAAVQRASEIQRMKFDVVVQSPIVVFPSAGGGSLVVKLGEIAARNEFIGSVAKVVAGLTGIRVTSNDKKDGEERGLKLIEDVGIETEITTNSEVDHQAHPNQPETQVGPAIFPIDDDS